MKEVKIKVRRREYILNNNNNKYDRAKIDAGEDATDEQVLAHYDKLAGLIKDENGNKIENGQFWEAEKKRLKEEQEKLVKKIVARYPRYDPREIKGPLAYSEMTDIDSRVSLDINKGYFIEAYALTDQYIETVIKLCFPEVFFEFYRKDASKVNIEVTLRCAVGLDVVDRKFLEMYRDFKSTRDDLIHKSMFNRKQAKQLENLKKVKILPLTIIKETENVFHKRCLQAYGFFLTNINRIKSDNPMVKDFMKMWYRIWKKQGRDLIKFLDDINRFAKGKNVNPPKN